jgi:hypothetical protein
LPAKIKKQVKRIKIILYLLTTGIFGWAQDSGTVTSKKWELSGYLKEMGAVSTDKYFHDFATYNLLHNRINVKWNPHKKFTAALEVRNRAYWGDAIRNVHDFSSTLRNENEWLNLSAEWAGRDNFVLHTNIDRGWAEFRQTKWNIRVGRQRINWGMTTIWNPNDIFNPYNFLDFDYEERPATDAAKFQYLFNDQSTVEVAVSPSDKKNRTIAAARYLISKWGYDLQIVAGTYHNNFTAGFGWAGKFGNLGYKGEGQAYIGEKDSVNRFNYSLELNYRFNKGWYASGSVLHNTSGIDEPVNTWAKINFRQSPYNLMPARWSFITIISKEFTPSLSSNLILVYSPRINLFIIYPSLKYKWFTNLEAELFYQSYFIELQKKFQATSLNLYGRLKYSF